MEKESNARDSSPKTLAHVVQQNIDRLNSCEIAISGRRQRAEQLAEKVTRSFGTGWCVCLHVGWFGTWILLNALPQVSFKWDTYPFPLLTLMVSLEAIFLSLFILISQNHDAWIAQSRARLDLQINLLAEQENTKMLQLLTQVAAKVGVEASLDPELAALQEKANLEELFAQIEKSIAASFKEYR
jgi:uncharacterized membrane protein